MSASKRFKQESTSFECLPNELFVEIFGYLNGVDTIYGFSQLNIRFQDLLNSYVRMLDFQCVSKAKFTYVLQVFNLAQCRSLRLSDDDKTPGQIELFSQFSFFPHYLSQLEYLSALNMLYVDALAFIPVIPFFTNLISLSIGNLCGLHVNPLVLPTLKQLTVTGCPQTHWLTNFENLESLHYKIECACMHTNGFVLPKTLKRLKLVYRYANELDEIRSQLSHLSQLNSLSLYANLTYGTIPNGSLWENLIVAHLPLLTTFQFCFPFKSYRTTLADLDEIIDSYSTPFYLIEKRWFIRCDRNVDTYNTNAGIFYSLPYTFPEMLINISSFDASCSTLPVSDFDEVKDKHYRKIRTIAFTEECKIPHSGLISLNIENLILSTKLPSSWLYLFSNICHLTIQGCGIGILPIDFENILRHTPKLQSLTISNSRLQYLTKKFSNTTICQYLSERIRSLTIADSSHLGYVSVRSLISIVRVFSANCEHLSLGLAANPNTLRPILKRMRKLRSLYMEGRRSNLTDEHSINTLLNQQSTNKNDLDFVHTDANKRHVSIWYGGRL